MRNYKKFLFLILIVPCIFLFNACSLIPTKNTVYVKDIKQTEVVGDTTTYTIYYSNGTTSLFTVENGKDGDDGDDLTIESIKQYCEANNIDFNTFLKEYLTIKAESDSVQTATVTAIQSAVSVWCEFPKSDYYTKDTTVSCGAGVIYQMNGTYSYIITNYHVVYYKSSDTQNKIAGKIHVFQYGTSEVAYKTDAVDSNGYPVIAYGDGAIEAEYIGGAMNYDIAILKVATADLLKYNASAKAVTLANNYSLAETAIAIGNPESDGISVTSGIISVVSEEIDMNGADESTPCTFRVMRIDTAVNGGNSGGGLFNIKGELIGIVNAKVVDSEIDNIAYAIPYDNAIKVANNLIYYYEQSNTASQVKKLLLDITISTENSRSIYNPSTNEISLKEDIVVNSVSEDSSVYNGYGVGFIMGLKAGDIIKSISINNNLITVNRTYELTEQLLNVKAGDKVIINVTRNNVSTQLGITTEEGILSDYLIIVK